MIDRLQRIHVPFEYPVLFARGVLDEGNGLLRDTLVFRQVLLALTLTAVLGYALNDSGIAIPALMVLVLECTAVYVVAAGLDQERRTPSTGSPGELVSSAAPAAGV